VSKRRQPANQSWRESVSVAHPAAESAIAANAESEIESGGAIGLKWYESSWRKREGCGVMRLQLQKIFNRNKIIYLLRDSING